MKIISSFSGGKTSAYMTYLLKKEYGDNLKVVFMNTGLEHEETLRFVNECDNAWDLKLDWIEAVVNHKHRVATKHRYVNFETATRTNSIAKQIVMKYGLFGVGYLHCTRELKLQPFNSWKKENGLCESFSAIGIRSDEVDRINENYEKLRLMYPLITKEITKGHVNEFWDNQDFTLNLIERFGNCKLCWKKSEKKIMANIKDHPEWLTEIKELEDIGEKGSDKMFRGNNSSDDLLSMRDRNLDLFEDILSGGCQTSCDIYSSQHFRGLEK